MAEKNQNFRSSYYDKVGFRNVEVKKSLEVIINEKPMDREKLTKFSLRFPLPSIYRELVWKVLLGVLSVNNETHSFVENQRIEQYSDTKKCLEVINHISVTTAKPVIHTLMYLMTEEVLLFDIKLQLENMYAKNLIAVASTFINFFSCEVTSYWLFKKFIIHQNKLNINNNLLREHLEFHLKNEDSALYNHLVVIKVKDRLPVELWFGSFFTGVLHQTSLIRVFDIVIGGSYKVLSYIGTAMLLTLRQTLLALNSLESILDVLEKIPEDTSDVIINKGFENYYSLSV